MSSLEQRVLILTPGDSDGANVVSVMKSAGFAPIRCISLPELTREIPLGACALFIAQEALTREHTHLLVDCLADQPTWSDIPLIIAMVSAVAKLPEIDKVFGDRVNISLLERPFSTTTLISVLRAAVRARNRQYEIRNLLSDLEIAREDAEIANRMKDDFLATVSHELRNPLNGILGFSQLLKRGNKTPEEVERGLDVIERNARVQAALIDDLLDISRIVSGNLRLDMQQVELAPIVQSAVESVRPSAETKQLSIILNTRQTCLPIHGDPARIQQIVWNLLTNAIKFSRKGGTIQIDLKLDQNNAILRVIDNGIGIASDFLPHVFDRFRQQDQTITRRKMGLGLGLSIVRHLVEMHLGRIDVQSAGIGKGAAFTVQLPINLKETILDETKNLAIDVPPYEMLQESTQSLVGIKILAVDDEADCRELIKAVLEECGAEVITASSVGEALVLMKEFSPNILLSDIGMPTEDGYELIKKVRKFENGSHKQIPAIALTAFSRPEDRAKSLKAGFQAHISKPVAASELTHLVNQLSRNCESLSSARA